MQKNKPFSFRYDEEKTKKFLEIAAAKKIEPADLAREIFDTYLADQEGGKKLQNPSGTSGSFQEILELLKIIELRGQTNLSEFERLLDCHFASLMGQQPSNLKRYLDKKQDKDFRI